MNTFLQIVIVCSNQCITEIPRVFTERIVIDTEPKGFHVLNHKHGGGSCVTLAEGMNLSNIRCKLYKVLHRRFHGQSLIGKLFFGGKIIIQRIFYAIKISIDNCFAVQYPFFFGNVILADLSGVVKYTLKQSAVNGNPLGRGKLKRLFAQKLRYSCRYNICLFGVVLNLGAGGSLLVIAVDTLLSFIYSDFTLDVILCGVQQIFGGFQPVNRLQTDSSLLSFTFFGSVRFSLFDIFFKFKLPILVGHICTSIINYHYPKDRMSGSTTILFDIAVYL